MLYAEGRTNAAFNETNAAAGLKRKETGCPAKIYRWQDEVQEQNFQGRRTRIGEVIYYLF